MSTDLPLIRKLLIAYKQYFLVHNCKKNYFSNLDHRKFAINSPFENSHSPLSDKNSLSNKVTLIKNELILYNIDGTAHTFLIQFLVNAISKLTILQYINDILIVC